MERSNLLLPFLSFPVIAAVLAFFGASAINSPTAATAAKITVPGKVPPASPQAIWTAPDLKTVCDLVADYHQLPRKSEDRKCSSKDLDELAIDRAQYRPVIVFVPDPQASSLALETDRAFDGIRLAAMEAGYIPYKAAVFPWAAGPEAKPEKSGDPNKADTAQPPPGRSSGNSGAWLFRRSEDKTAATQFLVVLIVGDSPVSGIRKDQFSHALSVVVALKSTNMEIAGPLYSGSYDSLRIALRKYPKLRNPDCRIRVVSGTATAENRAGKLKDANLLCDSPIEVKQMAHLTPVNQAIVYLQEELNVKPGEIGLLAESDTVFGTTSGSNSDGIHKFRFSRSLMRLRSEYGADTTLYERLFPQSRVRQLELAPSFTPSAMPIDALPVYSPKNSAVSQDSSLSHLAAWLNRSTVRYLITASSDSMDAVFLARYFQERSPNVRIFNMTTDAMLSKPHGGMSLAGTLTLSKYPIGVTTNPVEFESENTYNTFRALLEILKPDKVREWDKGSFVSVVTKNGDWPIERLQLGKDSLDEVHLSRGPMLAFFYVISFFALAPALTYLLQDSHARFLAPLQVSVRRLSPFTSPIWNAEAGPAMDAHDWWRGLWIALTFLTGHSMMLIFLLPVFVLPDSGPFHMWFCRTALLCSVIAISALFLCFLAKTVASPPRNPSLLIYVLSAAARISRPLNCALWCPWVAGVFALATPVFVHLTIDNSRHDALTNRFWQLGSGASPILPLVLASTAIHGFLWFLIRANFIDRYSYHPEGATLPFGVASVQGMRSVFDRLRNALDFTPDQWKDLPAPLISIAFIAATCVSYSIRVYGIERFDGHSGTLLWTLLFATVAALIVLTLIRFWYLWFSLRILLKRLEFHPVRNGLKRLPDRVSWTKVWSLGGLRPSFVSLQITSDLLATIEQRAPGERNTLSSHFRLCLCSGNETVDAIIPDLVGDNFPNPIYAEKLVNLNRSAAVMVTEAGFCLNTHWSDTRIQGWRADDSLDGKDKKLPRPLPTYCERLEELVAMQYTAYIRYAFFHLRNMLGFVALAVSLVFLALNVYPFQPHGVLSNCATFLFGITGLVMVTAFYQMDKDATLSRLSDTSAGKLDSGFGWRLFQFGSIPTLTFLSTHIPPLGEALMKAAEVIPGLPR